MPSNAHQLSLPVPYKETLRELGYMRRSGQSAIVRGIITDYANGTPAPAEAEEKAELMKVQVVIDDDTWQAAQMRAQIERTSVSQIVRDAIDRTNTSPVS